MGVTVAPKDLLPAADVTADSHVLSDYLSPRGADLHKVYFDFLRSQLPRRRQSYDSASSRLQSAAKEMVEEPGERPDVLPDAQPDTLSAKCIQEGGSCASFQQCDTSSHIYKGYCASDYSAVCCVPRRTICEANDGICTDDSEACLAAGEIMGRKYNLRFYTWMQCNTSHVCCRPSQAFNPGPAQQAALEDEEEEEYEDEEEEEFVDVGAPARRVTIGQKVRPVKGFAGLVNPQYEEYPGNSRAAGGSPRLAARGAQAGQSGRRVVGGYRPLPRPRALPQVLPGYGLPRPLPNQRRQTARSLNPGYASNSGLYPGLDEYFAAYANPGPAVRTSAYSALPSRTSAYATSPSRSNAYATSPIRTNAYAAAPQRTNAYLTSYPGQGNVPVQASYHQSSSAANPHSLFGNIFL